MQKSTLKKRKLPKTLVKPEKFSIVPIEQLKSSNHKIYTERLERLWRGVDPYSGRNYGYSIDPKVTVNLPDLLEFTGVVCYIGLERPFNISGKTTTPLVKMNWFLGLGAKAQKLDTLQQAEDILSYHHTCRLWKTHIAGQRHDYYFYSKFKSIEEFLDLLNVYMIMMS